MRQQLAISGAAKLFGGQPSDALHKRAGDLTAIDAGVDRLADVHQHIAAKDAHHPREAIDLHLGNRAALREIEKRRAASFVDVPIDALRRVEAAVAEAHALVVGGADELAPGELASSIDFRQARFDLAAGVDGGAAAVILAALHVLRKEARQKIVFEELAIRRDIAVVDAVAVLHPDLDRVAFQIAGDLFDDVLDRGDALRPTESAERGVRR